MAIKGVLKEELEKLPVGSLLKGKIKGHEYYYIVMCESCWGFGSKCGLWRAAAMRASGNMWKFLQ